MLVYTMSPVPQNMLKVNLLPILSDRAAQPNLPNRLPDDMAIRYAVANVAVTRDIQ